MKQNIKSSFLLLAAVACVIGSSLTARADQYDIFVAVRTGTGTLAGYTIANTLTVSGSPAAVYATGAGASLTYSGTSIYSFPVGNTTATVASGTTTFTNNGTSVAVTGTSWTVTGAYQLATSGSAAITSSTTAVYNATLNLPPLGPNGAWQVLSGTGSGYLRASGSGVTISGT